MSDYWKDNGIEKPQAIVVCAAIRFGEIIIAGARHWDNVMRSYRSVVGINNLRKLGKEEQGFINQFGEFLTREEAVQVVSENKQSTRTERKLIGGALFSEDLY